MSFDLSSLQNVKKNADLTITAACPACRAEGGDKTGNHLKIWPSGAFNCIRYPKDGNHNKLIRKSIKGDGNSSSEIVYIDPQPKLKIDKIFPEDSLKKLLPDYTYWLNRGAKQSVLERLECGLAPFEEKGKLAGRSVFPLRNIRGQIAGFSGRLVNPASLAPKWKHLGRPQKLAYPWNVTGEYIKSTKTCILCESIGDLIALLSNDVKPVLCIFGLYMNDVIISTLLANNIQKIVLSLNNDQDEKKGKAAVERIRTMLLNFWKEEDIIVMLPLSKDWGEASHNEIKNFKMEMEKIYAN